MPYYGDLIMNYKEFNKWYQVGQPVVLTDDFGGEHTTTTRSEAWELCGTSVVSCEGKGFGAYDLSRVRPLETHES